MNISEFLNELNNKKYIEALTLLYGNDAVKTQKVRYAKAVEKFAETYHENDKIYIFSAPGRTEIGGNHTDHQHGCVLAAAVDVDVIAVVAFNNSGVINVLSEGYKPLSVKLDNLAPDSRDNGTEALIRGVVSRFAEMGISVGGIDFIEYAEGR